MLKIFRNGFEGVFCGKSVLITGTAGRVTCSVNEEKYVLKLSTWHFYVCFWNLGKHIGRNIDECRYPCVFGAIRADIQLPSKGFALYNAWGNEFRGHSVRYLGTTGWIYGRRRIPFCSFPAKNRPSWRDKTLLSLVICLFEPIFPSYSIEWTAHNAACCLFWRLTIFESGNIIVNNLTVV